MTQGQDLAATLRKSFRINTRSRDRRDGVSLKRDMLEAITFAATLSGYYSEEKSTTYRVGFGAVQAYGKHVDGFRIDGTLRFHITGMSPWAFAGLLGEMVDAGVENCGTGEQFFAEMARTVRVAA